MGLVVAARGIAVASAPPAGEYALKAVFLLQFAQFVRWPQDAANEELVFGVLGTDPFGQVLEATLAGELIGDRRVQIERWSRVEEIGVCHVLFISESEAARLGEILAALDGRLVLTVGDFPGFAEAGGIIGLFIRDDRIRFRINRQRAEASGLEISSRLLSLAEIVGPSRSARAPE